MNINQAKQLLKVAGMASAALGGYLLGKSSRTNQETSKYHELENIISKHCGIPRDAGKHEKLPKTPIKIPSRCIRESKEYITVGTEEGFWLFQKECLPLDAGDDRIAARWLSRIPGAKSLYDLQISKHLSASSGTACLAIRLKGGGANETPGILVPL